MNLCKAVFKLFKLWASQNLDPLLHVFLSGKEKVEPCTEDSCPLFPSCCLKWLPSQLQFPAPLHLGDLFPERPPFPGWPFRTSCMLVHCPSFFIFWTHVDIQGNCGSLAWMMAQDDRGWLHSWCWLTAFKPTTPLTHLPTELIRKLEHTLPWHWQGVQTMQVLACILNSAHPVTILHSKPATLLKPFLYLLAACPPLLLRVSSCE
jgi:hypothetical protein